MDQHNDTVQPPPADWLEAIKRGEADLAAGRTVSAAALLAEMQASNQRMAARIAREATDAA